MQNFSSNRRFIDHVSDVTILVRPDAQLYPSIGAVILRVKDDAKYFSHFTAISLNGLTDQTPKTVYFNIEQRLSGGDGQLTQEAIDRAFKAEPRVSSNAVEYKGTRIVKINGRNTQQLGVAAKDRSQGALLRITDIERTLVDSTVRPAYAGGIAVVGTAFERARDSISVNKLAAYLRKLRYVYPYHQAVGFYMERAATENRC